MVRLLTYGALLLAALSGAPLAGAASPDPAVVRTEQVRAELVAHAPDGIRAGRPLWLGLQITHEPHWHTYWKNPGDSGLPTTLAWQLPDGFGASEIAWPVPKPLPVGPLMNFGYEGTVLLPVAVTVPPGFSGDAIDIQLKADWLVCKDICIPQSGEFALRLPARAATVANAAEFDRHRAALPKALPAASARAEVRDGALLVHVSGLPAAWHGKALQFFPETAGVIDNAAKPATRWQGAEWEATVPLSSQRTESPAHLPAVLVAADTGAGAQLTLAVSGAWPVAGAAQPGAAGNAAPAAPAPGIGYGAALLLALLGGALLNLMPCVFPVLSLKVLGFAAHAHERRAVVAGGLAYTAGVVSSFVALAGLMLALRAGGEQLGWGFQLQSPLVVAGLAALFTLIGLNLAGAFEIGSLLPSALVNARARHPLMDSALTGVLAVAVASPCTAPFMGASLGLAFTLPATQALTVFAAVGLGMALPYLAASVWPAVARALPRPGPWMAHFKTLMAFPMFATVVWLVWVLGQQVGIDGAAALLGVLVALAFAAWAFGSTALGPRARRGFGTAAVLLLGAALLWMLPSIGTEAVARQPAPATATGWQAWSPARASEAQAAGRPVFVDFTAAWCVTCQFNKRTTLADARVLEDLERKGVLMLRADWTRRDPAITAELARLGRNGVPVYALYSPGAAGPRVLSEILSVREVRDALAALP